MATYSNFSLSLFYVVLFLVLPNNHGIEGTPTGAAPAACSDMTPGHGFPIQTGPCPYVTTATVLFFKKLFKVIQTFLLRKLIDYIAD